jgi:hypothetical protein
VKFEAAGVPYTDATYISAGDRWSPLLMGTTTSPQQQVTRFFPLLCSPFM